MKLIPDYLQPDGDWIETLAINGILSWLVLLGLFVQVMESVAAAFLTSVVFGAVFALLVVPAVIVNFAALAIVTFTAATAILTALL